MTFFLRTQLRERLESASPEEEVSPPGNYVRRFFFIIKLFKGIHAAPKNRSTEDARDSHTSSRL